MEDRTPSRTERVWTRKGVWLAVVGHPMGWRTGYARVPDDHPRRHYHDPEAVQRVAEYAKPETWAYPEHPLPDPGYMARWYADKRNAEGVILQDTWDKEISIHGGITYAHELDREGVDHLLPGSDGAPPGLWIGFDCAHSGDLLDEQLVLDLTPPGSASRAGNLEHFRRVNEIHLKWPVGGERTWTTEDVVAELEYAADQLAAGALFEQVKEVSNRGGLG